MRYTLFLKPKKKSDFENWNEWITEILNQLNYIYIFLELKQKKKLSATQIIY